MKLFNTDFFNKWDQIHSFLRIWSHLLKKSIMGIFIFYAVSESDMISKKLQNSDLMYYNVNLMTDVFKIIIKYCRKIIAKYLQILLFIAQWEPSVTKRRSRSSHRRCSVRKDVLRNFAKFTGKHLCQTARVSFLIKLQAVCNFVKKETLARCFPMNFAKNLRTPFL